MQSTQPPRREALRALLTAGDGKARTQSELVTALRRQGFPATQATVSRDLAALGAAHAAGAYRLPESAAPASPPDELAVLARSILRLDLSGEALLVLRTGVGMAQRAALALDRLGWPEVAGTVAGDDTIFVALQHRRGQRAILERLRAALSNKNLMKGREA